jgi:uncharacterized protein (DUF3820 family)
MVKSVTTTPHRLRFGKYKGRTLDEVPPDYLNGLRKFEGLFAATRKQIESHLRALVRDPGRARMPFGCHTGQTLDELKTVYLDWLVGSDVELGAALAWLLKAELRRRESRVPVYTGEQEAVVATVFDAEGYEHRFPYTRPKVVGYVAKLPEVEDWVSFDTRGFIPSEALGGGDRKPSTWMMSRPRAQVQAEDEALNQVWSHAGGQRVLWHEGLGLPPLPVLHAKKERKRVYWGVIDGVGPVIKDGGEDPDTDVQRLLQWDVALEALDRLAGADDLDELEARHAEAVELVRLLAQDEGWDPDSNALLNEVLFSYTARREALERREMTFTDAPHRVEPTTRQKRRYAGDVEAARVHEVIRWLRGCRTEDALLDAAAWVRRHRDAFTEAALSCLRQWYRHFLAELRDAE